MNRTRHRVELPDLQRWNTLRARPVDRHVSADWFRITNSDGTSATRVDIYGEIGGAWWNDGVTAVDFIEQLRGITDGDIDLHINSPGGDVYDGIAIYQALLDHQATVNVQIDALAASAASFIAQAGDTITMGANAEMMIHDALGLCIGNAADMTEFAEMLSKASDNIASIYSARAGNGNVPKWRQRMTDETWYSANEAVEVGLADKVMKVARRGSNEMTDGFDLSIYKHKNRSEAPDPDLSITGAGAGDGSEGGVDEPEPAPPLLDELPWDPKAMHLAFLDAADAVGLVDDTATQRAALETDFAYDPDALRQTLIDLLDHPDQVEPVPVPQPKPSRHVDIDVLTQSLREALSS